LFWIFAGRPGVRTTRPAACREGVVLRRRAEVRVLAGFFFMKGEFPRG
jgi:hypothetical protein